mmetsp:Transcript_62676/g.198470  ORF Transcript_62676/g.198470 Transcript_62676/m.198470 type:complete len:231 (+) Transcript_62676:16-708(+)
MNHLQIRHVPQLDGVVMRHAREHSEVGGEGEALDGIVRVLPNHPQHLVGDYLNNPDEPIGGAGEHSVLVDLHERIDRLGVPREPIRVAVPVPPGEDAEDAQLGPAHHLLAMFQNHHRKQLVLVLVRVVRHLPLSKVAHAQPPVAPRPEEGVGALASKLHIRHEVRMRVLELRGVLLLARVPDADAAVVVPARNHGALDVDQAVDSRGMGVLQSCDGLPTRDISGEDAPVH